MSGILGEQNMNLGEITPYFFEGKLIISLSKEWMGLFKGIPKFKITLDKKNRLVIKGPEIKRKLSRKNSLSEHKKTEVLV